eukprot:TRINITY_DN27232_c0_g1_i8.p2 TRINITY_DN27232_c0_g1~~TRINITY_DN27232_c0_g1_i8.p2  ORF type:complete len:263 (+),score=-2.33 TRINITY_DN27232_c0_g1_i8:312-1100(+)
MDGPTADVLDCQTFLGEEVDHPGLEVLFDQGRDLLGEGHFEAMVADSPAHRSQSLWQDMRAAADDFVFSVSRDLIGGGAAADHGGGPIGKEGVGDHLFSGPAVVMMQAAEFDRTDQDDRLRIGVDVGLGYSQCVKSTVTSHESDVSARCFGRETQLLNEADIETWSTETAAGNRHEMSDLGEVLVGLGDGIFAGFQGKVKGMLFILLHAFAGRGTKIIQIAAGFKEGRFVADFVDGSFKQHGPALLDPRSLIDQLHDAAMLV